MSDLLESSDYNPIKIGPAKDIYDVFEHDGVHKVLEFAFREKNDEVSDVANCIHVSIVTRRANKYACIRYGSMLTISTMNEHDLISSLGGTTAVAKICGVKPQAVSQWKKKGIPKSIKKLLLHYKETCGTK